MIRSWRWRILAQRGDELGEISRTFKPLEAIWRIRILAPSWPPMPFANVHIIEHPVIQTKLTELRDYTADHRKFRTLLDEIAGLMVYEATRDWPTKAKVGQTLLEKMPGEGLARGVTLGQMYRGGLGSGDAVRKILPDA